MPARLWDGSTLRGVGGATSGSGGGGETPPPAPTGVLTLHFAEADLDEMRTRRISGPFHTAGNGAPFGDWTRIESYKDSFMAAPLGTRWAGPTGNNPAGAVRNASDPGNNLNQTNAGNTFRPPDKPGGWLRDAAFYAWVHPGAADAAAVAQQAADSLVAQVNYQDTEFGDGTRWSTGTGDQSDQAPWWVIGVWMLKQLYAYDFLTAYEAEQSVSLFTSGERTAIQAWFEAFATVAAVTDVNQFSDQYSNRATYAITADAQTIPGHSRPRYRDSTGQAEAPRKISIKYNNRSARTACAVGMIGVRFGNTTLRDVGVRYVKEALRYGCYPDGSCSDFERGEASVAEPTVGWKYSCEFVGMMVLMAHGLWVYEADAQLFTESTSDGHSESAGGPKTLKTAVLGLLRHVNNHYVRYVGNGTFGNTEQRIKPGGPSTNNTAVRRYNDIECGPIMDHYLVATADGDANTFRDLYLRDATGTNPQPTPPIDGQGDVEGGPSGVWPAALFCFGRDDA